MCEERTCEAREDRVEIGTDVRDAAKMVDSPAIPIVKDDELTGHASSRALIFASKPVTLSTWAAGRVEADM